MIKDDGSDCSPLQGPIAPPIMQQLQQQQQLQLQQLQQQLEQLKQQHQTTANGLGISKSQMPSFSGGLTMNPAATASNGENLGMPDATLASPYGVAGANVLDACLLDLSRRRIGLAEHTEVDFPPVTVGSSEPPPGSDMARTDLGNFVGDLGRASSNDGSGLSFGGTGMGNPTRMGPTESGVLRRMAQGIDHSSLLYEGQQQQQHEDLTKSRQSFAEQAKKFYLLREEQEARLKKMRQNQEDRKRERAGMPLPQGFNLGSAASEEMGPVQGQGVAGVQWWVCRKCQARAFASKEQALDHEASCHMGQQDQANQEGVSDIEVQRSLLSDIPFPFQHNPPASLGISFQPPLSLMDVAEMRRKLEQKQIELQRQLTMQSAAAQVQVAAMHSSTHGGLVDSPFSALSGNRQDRFHQALLDSNNAKPSSSVDEEHYVMVPNPIPLAMSSDKDWITPLHCFIRRHCVEVFTATAVDVATPSKGKRRPIQVGQVGIRCPHCHSSESSSVNQGRERGSVYYPTTIASIYNATMNLLQRHLDACPSIPPEILSRYRDLKADDARSATSKKYWIDSAKSLGLVDTENGGIRFSSLSPPPLPELSVQQVCGDMRSATRRNSLEFFAKREEVSGGRLAGTKRKSESEHLTENNGESPLSPIISEIDSFDGAPNEGMSPIREIKRSNPSPPPLVLPDDKSTATEFSFKLLSQMRPCVFTEADRLGKRKGLPAGFVGLACRHCYGGYGSGRFFPSSIKTLSDTSKTLNVFYNHMMRCRKCPAEVRDTLEKLKCGHDEERARMKFGSQKAFFAKIWDRLHDRIEDSASALPVNDTGKFNPEDTRSMDSLRPAMISSSLSHRDHPHFFHHPMVNPFESGLDAHPRMSPQAGTMTNMAKLDPTQVWTGTGTGGGNIGIPMDTMDTHMTGPPPTATRRGMRPGAA